MPTEIVVQNREFKNQYDNGNTFADNPSEFTLNLAGSVMEKIQVLHQVDIRWFFQASSSNPVDFENLGSDLFRFKKANGGEFSTDGFSIGDDINWQFPSGGSTISRDGTVNTLDAVWMYVQFSTSTTISSGQSTGSLFQGTSDLTAILYNFGLIGNTENFNTLSKVSGNNQGYYASSLTEGGGSSAMTERWQYRDWVTGSASVERLTNPSTYVQRFEITHEFIINPFYLDGQLSNLQNNITPTNLNGLNSFKYVFNIDARTALSNPNSSKVVTEDQQLGSVAWFNENFNGFQNIYSVDSVTYEDNATGDPADGLLIGSDTVVVVTISKSTGAFVSTDRIGAFVAYLPPADEYTNTLTDLESNFMYGNGHCLADTVAGTVNGVITDIDADLSGGDIELSFIVDYSTAQKTVLGDAFNNEEEPRFVMGIQIGDITLLAGDSDRVMILADTQPFDANADISGLFGVVKNELFKHNKTIDVDTPTSDIIVWNEEGFTWDLNFTLDLNKDAYLNTLEVVWVAQELATGNFFKLDSYSVPNISNALTYPDSGFTVQSFEFSGTRGYPLATGSQFNEVTLETLGLTAGVQSYGLTIGQKASWQEWLSNLDVDNVFFNSSEPQNNLNFKTSNYSNLNGYLIHIGLLANVTGTNPLGLVGDTDYLTITASDLCYDYGVDPTNNWTATIETFDSTGTTNLGGGILPNEDTYFKVTWVSVIPVASIAGLWAIHRIEETNQGGYNIEELSTIRPFPAGQILKPLAGETQLKMSIDSGDVITEGLIDYTKLVAGQSYNLSAQIEGVPS